MKALVLCLIGWLAENRADSKAWRILDALAADTLKRIDSPDPTQREFDVLELAQACESHRAWDYEAAKRWFNGAKVDLFLQSRQGVLETYFRDQGHSQAIALNQRKTTGRHRAPWFLSSYDLQNEGEGEQSVGEGAGANPPQTGSGTVDTTLLYEFTPASAIQLSLVGRLLLGGNGVFRTWSARGLFWAILMMSTIALAISSFYLFWNMRLVQRPLMTSDLVLTLMSIGSIWIFWRFLIRPWVWLVEDRIVPAEVVLTGFKEEPAHLELARLGGHKFIRLVRYGGVCPVCAGRVELRYGLGVNARRLFGCCEEAPHDHVFTFDRVTRTGSRYVT